MDKKVVFGWAVAFLEDEVSVALPAARDVASHTSTNLRQEVLGAPQGEE